MSSKTAKTKSKKRRAKKARVKKAIKKDVEHGRTNKDGSLVAVNIYVHKELLDRLDKMKNAEGRSRRMQLQLLLCKALGVNPSTL